MNIFYSYDFEMELLELVERPSLSSRAKQLASIRRTGLGDAWIGDWGLGIPDSGCGLGRLGTRVRILRRGSS